MKRTMKDLRQLAKECAYEIVSWATDCFGAKHRYAIVPAVREDGHFEGGITTYHNDLAGVQHRLEWAKKVRSWQEGWTWGDILQKGKGT